MSYVIGSAASAACATTNLIFDPDFIGLRYWFS